MLATRVIPVLLLQNKGLVKTVRFDKSKYIGDPINAVRLFNDKEVDELVFLDIEASKKGKKPDFDLIKSIASECFMPLGYGGGITSIDDISRLFSIGVEKVIINTGALLNFDLVSQAAAIYGDQSIVVSIDAVKNFWGGHQVFSHSKVKHQKSAIEDYALTAEKAGSGEILINSVDQDGQMTGYDLKLIEKICAATTIPVVACGGAGSLSDFRKARESGASAVAAGSFFIYHGPHRAVLINYPTQQQLKAVWTN
jgi:imidazole glycerol-phosphate synthase subunit HisF